MTILRGRASQQRRHLASSTQPAEKPEAITTKIDSNEVDLMTGSKMTKPTTNAEGSANANANTRRESNSLAFNSRGLRTFHYEPTPRESYYNPNFPDFPWPILTLTRLLQLLIVNVSIFPLAEIDALSMYLEISNLWYCWVLVAMGCHVLIWVLEEKVVREMKTKRFAVLTSGLVIISFGYTVCDSFIVTTFYIIVDSSASVYVALGVVCASVLYFGYHLHWVYIFTKKYMANKRANDSKAAVTFDHIVRPGVADDQLHFGPLNIWAPPEEYAVPGIPG